ncbi:MAG: hypothetical protein KAR39_03120 [Thermoplasmata archaeon]|nr:hypothetical protein [Thermoplasmata archaeon]
MSKMEPDDKGERRFAGRTLEEVGELLKAYIIDADWALSKMDHLRKEYPNRFIAVVRKKVVASSRNWDDVVAELEKMNLKPNFVFTEYITKDPVRYLLHT